MNQKNNLYSPVYVKELFDEMSHTYGLVNLITSFGFTSIWRKVCIAKLDKSNEAKRSLDLMSGMGETLHHLQSRFPSLSDFTLVDFSTQMCVQAREKTQNMSSVKVIEEDVFKVEIEKESVDLITCSFGLKTLNLEQQKALAKLVFDLLKPQGQFTFIEISRPPNRILHFFVFLYLRYLIPLFGKIFLGNPDNYRHLALYTYQFGNARYFYECLFELGLEVNYLSHFFGSASGVYGKKKGPIA